MGGHSHWSTIKRQKGASDAKRGQLFTKLSKEITVAAREGGGAPNANPRLRLAIDKARESNMAADTIKRAIDRGAGGAEAEALVEATFEGYGADGARQGAEGAGGGRPDRGQRGALHAPQEHPPPGRKRGRAGPPAAGHPRRSGRRPQGLLQRGLPGFRPHGVRSGGSA